MNGRGSMGRSDRTDAGRHRARRRGHRPARRQDHLRAVRDSRRAGARGNRRGAGTVGAQPPRGSAGGQPRPGRAAVPLLRARTSAAGCQWQHIAYERQAELKAGDRRRPAPAARPPRRAERRRHRRARRSGRGRGRRCASSTTATATGSTSRSFRGWPKCRLRFVAQTVAPSFLSTSACWSTTASTSFTRALDVVWPELTAIDDSREHEHGRRAGAVRDRGRTRRNSRSTCRPRSRSARERRPTPHRRGPFVTDEGRGHDLPHLGRSATSRPTPRARPRWSTSCMGYAAIQAGRNRRRRLLRRRAVLDSAGGCRRTC